ncbi:MAG: T9SS C-terminal target domain-containing protein [Calditrichaeota bacterium]|nr:MAG: T9SS C-terminal target domain-containing protein [Calditrichota bacterium]
MKKIYSFLTLAFLCFGVYSNSFALPGDTTYVTTFDEEFHNWATPHDSVFVLPSTSGKIFSKVTLFYTIACPYATPGAECDPWDRTGYLGLFTNDTTYYEVARIITPYSISQSQFNGPGSCTWEIDVTDYQTLLSDSLKMRTKIESWIGGERGWIVTTEFQFIEAEVGEVVSFPYKVENLWQNYSVVYGDPAVPIDSTLAPIDVMIDINADSVKMRVMTTGHGQGGYDNAAEFYNSSHYFFMNGNIKAHNFWRSNCPQNTCSPQGGNWTPGRFGWCPGDKVDPLVWDVTSLVTPGQTATAEYRPDLLVPYENVCRPNNPNCVTDPNFCPDCNYNSTGHTQPIYSIQSQLVFYQNVTVVGVEENSNPKPENFILLSNYPNPFNPSTTINYELQIMNYEFGSIQIFNLLGEKVREFEISNSKGSVVWDGTNSDGKQVSSGIYLYTLKAGKFTKSEKMLLLK